MSEKLLIDGIDSLKLEHTFECGQSFRWYRDGQGDEYTGVAFGKPVHMKKVGHQLIIENTSPEDFQNIWLDYLDLERDYTAVKEKLAAMDPMLQEAVKVGHGIRILKQDLWETIGSFIISANNNIPRIKSCIEGLAESFGDYLGKYRGKEHFAFPSVDTLASLNEKDLEPIKLGYRNSYLLKTARYLADGGMEEMEALRSMDIGREEMLKTLQKLPGVGPKVANCIALFGLARTDTFPIDVWMKRTMGELFGMQGLNEKTMESRASEMFGPLAGFAQQYLFYSARKGVDLVGRKL